MYTFIIRESGLLINTGKKIVRTPCSIQTKNKDFIDIRNIPLSENESVDFEHFKVYGCELAKTFIELQEEELGRLYCYVDAAKSMAEDPDKKFIHTDCLLCGDDYCSFQYSPTSEKEKEDFKNNNRDWKTIDPLLFEKKK